MFSTLEARIQIIVAMSALYGVLAVTSLSVALATRGATSRMLSNQVNAWWKIFPIISLVLLTYPLGPMLLASLVCVLAVLELAPHYPGPQRDIWLGSTVLVTVVTVFCWRAPTLSLIAWISAVFLQALFFTRSRDGRALIWLLVLATVGAMAVLVGLSGLPFGTVVNLAWLFYLFTLTALNDIGQFVAGKLFGRNKIAPTISPNKTWQGLIGGLVVSQFASQALGNYLVLSTPAVLAAYSVLLSLGGFAGDLMFSAAKRYLLIKDFSQLIPGHGGILDRIDSLVVTAPLFYCLLSISV
jgi:phosphatidate cytidylyltransferase